MLKSTQGTAGAETIAQDTPSTVSILMFTATALVAFLMIYLTMFDGSGSL